MTKKVIEKLAYNSSRIEGYPAKVDDSIKDKAARLLKKNK